MTYPDDLTTVTVRHTVTDTSGRPSVGPVLVTLTDRLWTDTGTIVPTKYIGEDLGDGVHEFVVPALDQDGITPQGAALRITEQVPGTPMPFYILPLVEHAAAEHVWARDIMSPPPKPGGGISYVTGPVTDSTMAEVAGDSESAFAGALKSTIATEAVPPARAAAADYLASEPAVVDAAASAVAQEAADLDLLTEPGANVARTIKRLQAGENLTVSVVGDSIADPTTPGNTGGGPVEKWAALIDARYGTATTVVNEAKSGFTAARAYINGHVSAAIDARPDVLFVCLGKNDIGSDIYGQYAPGYPRAASLAAVERMFAAARRDSDKADLVLILEGPYIAGSSSNDWLRQWQTAARSVAAAWGAEVIDVYQAFTDYGDYADLMYDSTHQNPAGNDFYAAVMAEHFPATFRGGTTAIAAPARRGLYRVDTVDLSAPNYGYALRAAPGTGPVDYITTGAGWADEATSQAGDSLTVAAHATELLVQISTATEDATVVDIAIDGAPVAANVAMAEQGKNGNYWVPFALDLTPGDHTLTLTLKAGTLRTYAVAALLTPKAGDGGAQPPDGQSSGSVFRHVITASTTATLTTTYQTLASAHIQLPDGWSEMAVVFSGYVATRTVGGTTAVRRVDVALRAAGTTVGATQQQNVAAIPESFINPRMPLTGGSTGHAGETFVDIIARLDDDTDTIQAFSYRLDALLIRTA